MADKVEVKLTEQEEKELRDGQSLYEMTKTSGFQVLKQWLTDMAYHSWVDPREAPSKDDWMWRELNAFHASNNAHELLTEIQKAVSQAEYLQKKKNGEITNKRMRF